MLVVHTGGIFLQDPSIGSSTAGGCSWSKSSLCPGSNQSSVSCCPLSAFKGTLWQVMATSYYPKQPWKSNALHFKSDLVNKYAWRSPLFKFALRYCKWFVSVWPLLHFVAQHYSPKTDQKWPRRGTLLTRCSAIWTVQPVSLHIEVKWDFPIDHLNVSSIAWLVLVHVMTIQNAIFLNLLQYSLADLVCLTIKLLCIHMQEMSTKLRWELQWGNFNSQNEWVEQEKHILGVFMRRCVHAVTVPIPQSSRDSV